MTMSESIRDMVLGGSFLLRATMVVGVRPVEYCQWGNFNNLHITE